MLFSKARISVFLQQINEQLLLNFSGLAQCTPGIFEIFPALQSHLEFKQGVQEAVPDGAQNAIHQSRLLNGSNIWRKNESV